MFTEEQTEILLKTITENKILGSLTDINLTKASYFYSNMNASYIALLLAKAKNLKKIYIGPCYGYD